MADLEVAEGRTTWMYLDTAAKPVVTCGVGHALFSVNDALKLPWDQPGEVVAADYAAVLAAPRNYRAAWYARLTKSRLTEACVTRLKEADADRELNPLRHSFPKYDTYPAGVQEALKDMAFNLGGGFASRWPAFYGAVMAEDWERAANECHRAGISAKRNQRTAELLRSGVVE